MNKLKELQEQRGAKVEAATTITDLAATEKRNLTSEEISKLDTLHGEIKEIDENIRVEVKQESLRSTRPVELSKQEARDMDSFDFGKFLRGMRGALDGSGGLDGIELEMALEGRKEADEARLETKGVMLPRAFVRRRNPWERRDLTATGGTSLNQGGMTIQTDKLGLADDFYNRLVLRQGGATVLENLQGNLDLPRYVQPSNPAHKTENETAAEVSPTTSMLSLSPKRLPAFVDISDQLMRQSSVVIETIVRNNLNSQLLGHMENIFINGGGTSQPSGILQTSGIGDVAGGTNGAAPDWADIVNLETEVAQDNADIGSVHYVTNTKVRGKLKQTAKVSSTDSVMVWSADNSLNGYVPLVTNACPSTLTKGSSGAVCSAIIFGNLQDLIMAFWGGLSFELIRDSATAKVGMHLLYVSVYYDGGVLRAQSFAAMKDALTT
jgi:HK97 family phage major capsid protein